MDSLKSFTQGSDTVVRSALGAKQRTNRSGIKMEIDSVKKWAEDLTDTSGKKITDNK